MGFLIAAGLAAFGWYQRDYAQQAELKATRGLFDSTLTHASLLTKVEDFAATHDKLEQTRELDLNIPAPRRHARDLLAGFADIMGGVEEYTYPDDDKPLPALTGGVAISPDGHWLAASGERGTVALFERASGKLVQKLEGHNAEGRGQETSVFDIVFHPKQPWLFSGGDDGQIIRWALPQDGQPARRLQQWSADAQGQAFGKVKALALTPDGKVLASGHDDGKIRLWAVEETPPGLPLSGEEEDEPPKLLRVLEGHSRMIAAGYGLAFSPDGRQLASASYDNTVRLWDWENGKAEPQVLQGTLGDFNGVAFSEKGDKLAASGDSHILIWDTATGQRLQELKGHQNMVFGLQFLPDGLLASASSDNTIRLWDVATSVTRRILQGHTAAVGGLALWQQGQAGVTLYSASNDGTVKHWGGDLPQQWLVGLPGELTPNAISPDGQLVVVGFNDGSLRVYSLPDGEGKPELLHEMPETHKDRLVRLAFNSDGSHLASSDLTGVVKIWSVQSGKAFSLKLEKTFTDHKNVVHAVAFSPDGSQLATASYDGRIGLFALEGEGKPQLFEAHDGEDVNAVSYSADGKYLSSASDRELKLWDLTTQPPTAKTLATANDALLWASLSPDGDALASAGRGQSKVSVYPTSGADAPLHLNGHEQAVFKAIFSPDSRQLATVSSDMTVRLWDLDTQSELFRLLVPTRGPKPNPIWDFDFRCTPTGCWIAVPLTSGKLALYNLGKIKDYSAEEIANSDESVTEAPAADAAAPKVDEARILEAEKQYQQAIEQNPQDADALYDFAVFEYNRKHYDEAEKLFKQALNVDPKHTNALTAYAIFLHHIQKDYSQAEPRYRKVIAEEPNNPDTLVNLAQIVLSQGKLEEGRRLINESFGNHPGDEATIELWFYRLAHFPTSYPYAQQEIVDLLKAGVRDDWDFSATIAQAEKAGHPNVPLLQALADVITSKAELGTLTPYLEQ